MHGIASYCMVLYVIACYGTVLHRNIFIAWYTMLSYGIERFQAVSIYATMWPLDVLRESL